MKFLKHKKINKRFTKKPGRPKKLPTRASSHQKRISKSSVLTRRSRAKLGENYNMLTVGSLLYKKKIKRRARRNFRKESTAIEDSNSDAILQSNKINLNVSAINNAKLSGAKKELKFCKPKREPMKKYIINEIEYFSLSDLLVFLELNFGIDYQNHVLKEELKNDFKEEINRFLKTSCIVLSKKNLILLKAEFVEEFYSLLLKFIEGNCTFDKVMEKFNFNAENLPEENVKQDLEYVKSTPFVCESAIKYDDLYKKRNGQYLKYKTIPKWHHYAWDMINQISNSRKSFIFSKYIEEDDLNEYSRKKIDLDTIILKLKLKIYNNIYEFIDDVMKMLKYSVEYMQRMGSKNKNVKNSSFCKLMEARLQKQIRRLKEDNKI